MNEIRDGLLKESRFNILSKKRSYLFCIVNKVCVAISIKKDGLLNINLINPCHFLQRRERL